MLRHPVVDIKHETYHEKRVPDKTKTPQVVNVILRMSAMSVVWVRSASPCCAAIHLRAAERRSVTSLGENMEGEKPKPLRLAEVFADSRKVVLSDRGSMLVGNIVAEGNGPTLAVLDDGRCVTALADDREWFMVELSLRGEGWLANVWSEPLTEIERF